MIRLAATAAPKPLSILTTVTPAAQEFNIAEQRRQAAEAGAVADAGRDPDHRLVHQTGDDAWESALHSGDDDEHARPPQVLVVAEQAVDARDADVVEALDRVAGQLRGQRRLLGDGQVGGPRRDHENGPADGRIRVALAQVGETRARHVGELRHVPQHGRGDVGLDPGDEHVVPALLQPAGDLHDLGRGLPLPEHDLRQPAAHGAVMIDLGEAEVLEGQVLHQFERVIDRHLSARYPAEEVSHSVRGHATVPFAK